MHADVLLHVVDAASPARDAQIEDVNTVLAEIGADRIPQILVWNKIDRKVVRRESTATRVVTSRAFD